jgi:hypothetical protein
MILIKYKTKEFRKLKKKDQKTALREWHTKIEGMDT